VAEPYSGGVVHGLVGVYNARGGLAGELAYVLGKLTGRAHCGLCDVTHGTRLRGKPEWRRCAASLPASFETVHLDERDAELASLPAPCVAARTDEGLVLLLGPAEIDACRGSPPALVAALLDAARSQGLAW
jgi:hypothetical protein